MTIAQISGKTGIPAKEQSKALNELVGLGFLALNGTEYSVDRWTEFQADTSAAERKHRERLKAIGLTEEGWQEIIARQGGRCAFCHAEADLLIDHILPKALGGMDEPSNIQALCRPCSGRKNAGLQRNSKKGAKGDGNCDNPAVQNSDNPEGSHEGRHGDTTMGSHAGSHDADIDKDKEREYLYTQIAGAGVPKGDVDAVADFVAWFVRAGVESKAVAEHLDFAQEVVFEAQRSAKDAAVLLKTYGREKCEQRARLFFARLMEPKGRGTPWIKTLSERWTWFEARKESRAATFTGSQSEQRPRIGTVLPE